MTAEPRTLHRKLAQVMYEADRIPKNGTAPAAMGGYPFVQVGDAADVIRRALAEQKVSMIPTAIELVDQREVHTAKGGTMDQVTVRTTWTLTDGDSGETVVIQSMGAGADVGDKAIPKAQTNAMKYALLMGFLLSTGDDPEAGSLPARQPPAAAGMPAPAPETPREGSLIGIAELAKAPHDYELRQGPDGASLGFGLKEGRQIVRVIAHGPLADALAAVREQVVGKRVECFGTIEPDSWIVNAGTKSERTIPYLRLILDRIATPDFLLPAAATDTALDAEIAALPMFDAA